MNNLLPFLACVLLLVISCREQSTELTDEQKAAIIAEVEDQYADAISNQSTFDIERCFQHWSEDEFISVTLQANYFSTLSEFIDSVTYWFSLRENQEVHVVDMNTKVLSSDLVLLTSIENWDILFKSGADIKDIRLLMSRLWKKEPSGWKIIYLHESW